MLVLDGNTYARNHCENAFEHLGLVANALFLQHQSLVDYKCVNRTCRESSQVCKVAPCEYSPFAIVTRPFQVIVLPAKPPLGPTKPFQEQSRTGNHL